MKILGVDISKAKFDMVLMDAERLLFQDERKYQHKVFKNTQQGYIELVEWLMDQNVYELHACMEATSTYGDALAEYLYCCGYKVSMVNPSQVTNFRKSELVRTKTDRNDASVIARFCWSVNPSPWKPLSMENRKLKALTNRLKELETMRQQEKNRLKTPGLDPDVAASIEKHIDILDNEVKDILRRMKNHTSANEEMQMIVERITSIPGVGEKTAMSLL